CNSLLCYKIEECTLMALLKAVVIACLLLVSSALSAQTTDTVRHDDTVHYAPPVIADTPDIDTATLIIPPVQKDTVAKKPAVPPGSGYVIHGKVADMNTGEGIPFANVFLPHSNVDTPADL